MGNHPQPIHGYDAPHVYVWENLQERPGENMLILVVLVIQKGIQDKHLHNGNKIGQIVTPDSMLPF